MCCSYGCTASTSEVIHPGLRSGPSAPTAPIQTDSRKLVTEDEEEAKAMTLQYVALIRKEEATDYWVDIPDLPGCVSSGDPREEAEANIQEALSCILRPCGSKK